jgi:hypothetical protein
MFEIFFFVLGLVNSAALIFIFLIRKKRLDIIQRVGWAYLLLAIPAICGIILAEQQAKSVQYSIFLGIFLVFLLLEWLLDYIFKINFRENMRRNWKLVIPYLGLYYAMNYGFIVMPWKTSIAWGIIMLGLFIVQIITNLRSHPKMTR